MKQAWGRAECAGTQAMEWTHEKDDHKLMSIYDALGVEPSS